MGKRGIFDAFQAASGAVESVLNAADKELQLKAQMEVQDAALKDIEAFNQFTLDMQNSNDWENYEKKWENFKINVYNDTSKGLSSPFARRVYDSQYKNEEMKQRLLVKSIANQKMRAQDFTKGFDYINNVILSNSFADQEIIDETGNKFIKTGSQQKKELIDNKLYTMYEAGLLDYEQFNLAMRNSYANLMNHDMVTLGKNLVDGGASIEEVTSKLQEYKNEFVTVAGGRITAESVRGAATEEVEKYYYKQQKIRWDKGEQQASVIYKKMSDYLNKGDWDNAYATAQNGRNFIDNWDGKYNKNGFNPNIRDEYSDKFMLKDDVKIAGEYGGLAKMKPEEEVNTWLYWMKNGRLGKNGELSRLTHSEVINILTGDAFRAKSKILGESKAMAQTYAVLAKLDEEICKPPFCNDGVAASVKNIDAAIKQVLQQNKDFNTIEGQGQYLRILGEVKAQVYDYLSKTQSNNQKPEDIQRIVVTMLLGKNAEINDYFWGKEKKQAKEAGTIQANIAAQEKTGVYGEDLSNSDMKRQEAMLRNYALEQIRQVGNFSNNQEVLETYQADILDDGKVRFLNRKTNQIDYVIERGEDGSSKVYDVLKDEKGNLKLKLQDKTPSQIANEHRAEEMKERGFNRNLDTIGVNKDGTHLKSSEDFKTFVSGIKKEDRALFTQIRDDLAVRKDLKKGNISAAEQEKKLKDEFIRARNLLNKFETTDKHTIPEDIKKDFLSFYNKTGQDYEKVTLIDAYEYAIKNKRNDKVSLVTLLEEYARLKKERGLKVGNPLNSSIYMKAKAKEKKAHE
ncbi:hypothetical protein [Treponema denticola]|uniref:hypothetical protein n=1 Tax=Treponema denticola TaxID=158 RepID=UPI004037AFBA